MRGIGAPSKNKSNSNIYLERDNNISSDKKTNCRTFEYFFGNLKNELLNKLSIPSNKFGADNINKYYNYLNIWDRNFSFNTSTELIVLKLLQDIKQSKLARINNINVFFLNDGVSVLENPIAKLFNLYIMISKFPELCKIAK